MQFTLLIVTQLVAAVAAKTTSSTCGQLKGCYMVDLATKTETLLSTTEVNTYTHVAGKSKYSIRCDVIDGKIDEMEYTFSPDGTTHQTWAAPYWIDGSNGDYVAKADFLDSCGAKTLHAKGTTWKDDCFDVSYDIMANCPKACEFDLTAVEGSASVKIGVDNTVTIDFKNFKPNTVYTVWTDFVSRATKQLAADYPVAANAGVDLTYSGPGMGRGVGPAMATTDPVYEGMRLDLNSVKTDANGNGRLKAKLDYNLLKKGDSPVVAESFTMVGGNVIGGSWLRQYEKPITDGPSTQQLDKNGRPKVVRATAAGFTVVGHFKPYTHGMNPGVGMVDHFMGAMGDFPAHCLL